MGYITEIQTERDSFYNYDSNHGDYILPYYVKICYIRTSDKI